MKIALVTGDNYAYMPVLEKKGFTIAQYDKTDGPEIIYDAILADPADWVILEADKNFLSSLHALTLDTRFRGNVLIITERMDELLKNTVLSAGAVDIVQRADPEFMASYINCLENVCMHRDSSILLLDDNTSSIRIIESILKRFGHSIILITTLQDLISKVTDPAVQTAIVNTATAGLDLNALVRSYVSNADIRKIPFLAFRDMTGGISVHEITCGLNRVTRYILTPAEMYSFLADFLFRKELAGPMERIVHDSSFNQIVPMARESLRQSYRSIESSLCRLSGLMDEPVQKRIFNDSDTIRNLVVRSQGIRWLCRSGIVETISTNLSGE